MKKNKENRPISVVELLRFIACIFIIWYHSPYIRYQENFSVFHFAGAFLFVELFFMLTGYFTVKHFANKKYEEKSFDEQCKEAAKYTWKKFKVFLPYTIIAVLLMYLVKFFYLDFNSLEELLGFLKRMVLELTLLNTQGGGALGLTWYLAAVVVIYPIFCTFCQSKHKTFLFFLIVPFCLTYYLGFATFSSVDTTTLLRSLAGLSMGAIVYVLSEYIKKLDFRKVWIVFLSIAELLCFGISLIFLWTNNRMLVLEDRLYSFNVIFFFMLTLALLLSGKTLQSKIRFWPFDFLGKISLCFYLFHQVVNEVIVLYLNDYLSVTTKMIMLYVGTFVVSISVYSMVELAKIRLPSMRKVFLKDKT
ncbi:acyltransferase [Candidatus Saccharibacteria bacterium]|nr:acyltransferase [Candidatus Saccharibacteria bacterium]